MENTAISDEVLHIAEIRAFAASLRAGREVAGIELSFSERAALMDEARETLIDRLLLVGEAGRLGLSASVAEIDHVLAERARRFDGIAGCRAGMDTPETHNEISRQILVDKVLDRWKARVRRPSRPELQDYYRTHREQFFQPESVHVSHIVRHFESAPDPETLSAEIEQLRNRVLNGEEFATVASHHSDCPENGGDLGWIFRGIMVPAFDHVVFATPEHQLTAVFRTEFGHHFALVHARKEAGIPRFEEIRPRLEESLWLNKQDAEVGRALGSLRAKSRIEIQR